MEQKLSPKLMSLMAWKHIQEVNDRLDAGDSPNSVANFINKNGFKISPPLVYDYARLRKKAMVDGINIEHMIGIASKPLISKQETKTKSSSEKLKSEIDALDMVIQGGYNTLLEWADRPINPKTMMDAIRLKSELTDGNHGFLTNYGMEELRKVEAGKYNLIMEHLISYIPADKQQEAIDKIDEIEDTYYQSTPYYEEYLRAKGLSEPEIEAQLKRVAANQPDEDDTEEE